MSFKRIRVVVDLLSEEKSKKEAILNGNKFIRNRKINLKEMILFILNNKGKTLTLELNEYITKQRKNNKTSIFKTKTKYKSPNI